MSELDALAADLLKAPAEMQAATRAVVSKGALNIKNDWRAAWKGLTHAPALPAAIGYDVAIGPGFIEATIGPSKDKRQGALGNLLEFGSVNNAPNPGGQKALDREESRFIAAIEAVAGRVL